ncbi:hypothetical protein [Halobacillus hunanensis]|uniref:hypothetical protein n=1 Tax=Halobacillus hunanensis TaxID=578214 RepID=UPI0009A6D548|nr:hypothetical protein [Halobacillus hunanensis]
MKRFHAFSLILALGIILGACGTAENQDNTSSQEETNQQESEPANGEKSTESSEGNQSSGESKDMNLASEVDNVIKSVNQLNSSLKDSANDVKTINGHGKTLEENWDSIEKQVEEQFPDQYKKIEESLYPLIGEAKQEDPKIDKMKEWAQTTVDSLNELKQKIKNQ